MKSPSAESEPRDVPPLINFLYRVVSHLVVAHYQVVIFSRMCLQVLCVVFLFQSGVELVLVRCLCLYFVHCT